MIKGYDVSHWQTGKTTEAICVLPDTKFLIVKATEGESYIDSMINMHASKAYKPGKELVLGFYHYARAEKNQPEDEAAHFVNTLIKFNMLKFHPFLVLDFEGESLKIKDPDGWARQWCDTVYHRTHVRPMLYVQLSAVKKFPSVAAGNYGLWVAKWSKQAPAKKPAPWKFWAIWQKGQEEVNGKEVDVNVFNGSIDQLRKYGIPDGK